MEQFVKTLLAARRVSTPLVAIRTADPALTVARIEEAVGKDAAIVQWDIVRGLVRVNDAGVKEIGKVLGERDPASVGPVDATPKWRRRFGICVTCSKQMAGR